MKWMIKAYLDGIQYGYYGGKNDTTGIHKWAINRRDGFIYTDRTDLNYDLAILRNDYTALRFKIVNIRPRMHTINRKMVYLVKQTQEIDYYNDKTIYVCSTRERAIEYCQKLNKEYGCGCQFDDDWNFIMVDDIDNCHYYNWEGIEVDEELILP